MRLDGWLPWWLSGKEFAYSAEDCLQWGRCGFDLWVRKTPWKGNGNPLQYSWASLVSQMVKESAYSVGRPRFYPWVRKIPWRRAWQPIPIFLPEKSMDRGKWKTTVYGVTKNQTLLRARAHTHTNTHTILFPSEQTESSKMKWIHPNANCLSKSHICRNVHTFI